MTGHELTDDDKEKLAEILEANKSHGNHRYGINGRDESGRFKAESD